MCSLPPKGIEQFLYLLYRKSILVSIPNFSIIYLFYSYWQTDDWRQTISSTKFEKGFTYRLYWLVKLCCHFFGAKWNFVAIVLTVWYFGAKSFVIGFHLDFPHLVLWCYLSVIIPSLGMFASRDDVFQVQTLRFQHDLIVLYKTYNK